MSYQDKISRVLALIEEHNKALAPEGQVVGGKINPEQFVLRLKQLGASNETTLAQCTWEDLQECGLPKLLARQAAQILRESPMIGLAGEGRPGRKKVKDMNFTELFSHYRPSEETGDDAVAEKLRELSSGKKCLVLIDGVVHAERSATLLQELRRGYPERDVILVDDKPVRVLAIGEKLDDIVDENPLYPGRALRPDGTCDQTNRSWEGVDMKIRQLLRIALTDTKEIGHAGSLTVSQAHDILDAALCKDLAWFTARYQKSIAWLETLALTGHEPRLKVSLKGLSASGGRKQNPFVQA